MSRPRVSFARLPVDRVPGPARIRFGDAGTEAVMLAIQAARACAGRDRIAGCEGACPGGSEGAPVSFGSRPDDQGPAGAPAFRVEATGRESFEVDRARIEPDLVEAPSRGWRAPPALGGGVIPVCSGVVRG